MKKRHYLLFRHFLEQRTSQISRGASKAKASLPGDVMPTSVDTTTYACSRLWGSVRTRASSSQRAATSACCMTAAPSSATEPCVRKTDLIQSHNLPEEGARDRHRRRDKQPLGERFNDRRMQMSFLLSTLMGMKSVTHCSYSKGHKAAFADDLFPTRAQSTDIV